MSEDPATRSCNKSRVIHIHTTKDGTGKKAQGKTEFFQTREEAYQLIQRKGVTSEKDFFERRPSDPELQQIPRNPYTSYEGWSWKKARGETQVEFFQTREEAYQLIQRKGVTSEKDFFERRPSDPELQQIPRDPYTYYEGWSWKKARGETEFFQSKEEAYQLIQRKGVTSEKDFFERRPSDPELQQIPAGPYQFYEGWSWIKAQGK